MAGQTREIDECIVRMAHKERPKFLFLPTASEDAEPYIVFINAYFCGMGCETSTLRLISEKPARKTVEEKISSADIIYVGGGDTSAMMHVWHEYGVDSCLRRAYQHGTILCGTSAGAICWAVFGRSESDSTMNQGWWDYGREGGLSLIPAAICPHYNQKGQEGFDRMMVGEKIPGIALEDGAALVEEDGVYHLFAGFGRRQRFFAQIRSRNIGKNRDPGRGIFQTLLRDAEKCRRWASSSMLPSAFLHTW